MAWVMAMASMAWVIRLDVSAILSSIVRFERPRDVRLGEMIEAGTLRSTEFNRNR